MNEATAMAQALFPPIITALMQFRSSVINQRTQMSMPELVPETCQNFQISQMDTDRLVYDDRHRHQPTERSYTDINTFFTALMFPLFSSRDACRPRKRFYQLKWNNHS